MHGIDTDRSDVGESPMSVLSPGCAVPKSPFPTPKRPKARRSLKMTPQDHVSKLPPSYQKRASEQYKKLRIKDPVMRLSCLTHNFQRGLNSPRSKSVAISVLKQHPLWSDIVRLVHEHESSIGEGSKGISGINTANVTSSTETPAIEPANTGQVSRKSRKPHTLSTREIFNDYRKITRMRARKKFKEIQKIRVKWEQNHLSLQKACKIVGRAWSSFYYHFTVPDSYVTGKGRAQAQARLSRHLSDIQKKHVIKFMFRDEITQVLPTKKYAKHRYLRYSFQDTYKLYVHFERANGRKPVSLTSLHRILPKKVFRSAGKIPFQNCACSKCTNFALLIAAARRYGLKGLHSSLSKVCQTACCESSDLQNASREIFKIPKRCRERRCNNCSKKFAVYLREQNPGLDMDKIVRWRQWCKKIIIQPGGRAKKDFRRHVFEGTFRDLITRLKLAILDMPRHIFDYQWQGEQFQNCLDTLDPGEVLMVVDFAKNFQLYRQREIQNAYFNRNSATLHPVIMYYHCPKGCGEVVVDEFMCVSPDLLHDSHAVHTYIRKAIDHLQNYNIATNKLFIFSDNCASQYKSCKAFEKLHNMGIPTEWHYFGSGHGKSRADGWTGRFKMKADNAIRSDTAGMEDAAGLAAWGIRVLNSRLTNGNCPDQCIHYEKTVIYVPSVKRSFKGTWRTLPGTLKIHSVQIAESGLMKVRANSCFCRYHIT